MRGRELPDSGVVAGLIVFAEPLSQMFFRASYDPVYEMTVAAFRILPLCMPFSTVSSFFRSYEQIAGKKLLKELCA